MEEILQVPGQITKISTLVDGGLNLTVNTQELVPEDITTLMGLKNKEGYFVFKLSKVIEDDIISLPEEGIEPFSKVKTPSQRLHGALYAFWKQQEMKEPFDNYYKRQMERFIQSVKDQLEP